MAPFAGLAWAAPGTLYGKVIWIFLISGVVALIVWIVGRFRGNSAPAAAERRLDVLKMRYAKGELGREKFEQMKREMTGRKE